MSTRAAIKTEEEDNPTTIMNYGNKDLLQLTGEQARGIGYPLGCSVWFNFSSESGDGEAQNNIRISYSCGKIEAVSIDPKKMKRLFTIKKEDGTTKIGEGEFAFGRGSPVTIDGYEHGHVLCVRPGTVLGESTMRYTIINSSKSSGGCWYEENVKASRVKCGFVTEAEAEANKAEMKAAAKKRAVEQEPSASSKKAKTKHKKRSSKQAQWEREALAKGQRGWQRDAEGSDD